MFIKSFLCFTMTSDTNIIYYLSKMKIAILDYDNTLSEGYAKYEVGYRLEEEGIIKKGFRSEIDKLEGDYEAGAYDYNEKFLKDKKIFTKYFVGLSRVEVSRFVENDFDLGALLYPQSKELIATLKNAGYMTVIISGCWDFIIEHAQELLDVDAFFASQFDVEKGLLGKTYARIMDNTQKRVITKQLLDGADTSIGLGDSIADFEFLTRVEHPFLLEGNKEAVTRAKEHSFTIVNRNDVIEKVTKVL